MSKGEVPVTEYAVHVKDRANAPSRPVRIALLCDLHDCVPGRDERALPEAVAEAGADLVLCGGDLVTAKAGMAGTKHALALIRKLSGTYPVYLSDGNHESRLRQYPEIYPGLYREYLQCVADSGAVLLCNRSRLIRIHGMGLAIHGFVQELRTYDRLHPGRICTEDLQAALGEPSHCGNHLFHLLIAHMPDHFPAYAAWGADLTVAGHLHGGIVRLPLLGGVFGSTYRPFPRYDKGMFAGTDGSRMVVSAGLGQHTLALRVNNPPELVMITLT